MTITLRIENVDQLPDGGPLQFQARQRGFDIGREQHLDWTLPDPSRFISGRHCEVRYERGAYWLYDVSRNGTFLNGATARVKSPHRLADGDRLQIGHYIVAVGVEADRRDMEPDFEEQRRGVSSPGDNIWDIGQPAPAPVDRREFMPPAARSRRAPDFAEQYLDIPEMRLAPSPAPPPAHSPFGESPFAVPSGPAGHTGYQGGGQAPAFPESPFAEPSAGAPVQARRPGPAADGFGLPAQRVRPNTPAAPAPLPSAQPQNHAPAAARAIGSASFLQALAEGARVAPEAFGQRSPDEVAREVGEVLRITTEQLAMLLKARAAAKSMAKSSDRTMLSALDNNPLKFLPDAGEIIEVMFARRRAGYLDARRSVEQAFADLKTHEIATFAAMQKALAKLLDGLSPQSIESRLPSSAFSSKKARAWDLFVERWDAKTDPYENGMLDVFLSYFAEAYDEAARKK